MAPIKNLKDFRKSIVNLEHCVLAAKITLLKNFSVCLSFYCLLLTWFFHVLSKNRDFCVRPFSRGFAQVETKNAPLFSWPFIDLERPLMEKWSFVNPLIVDTMLTM